MGSWRGLGPKEWLFANQSLEGTQQAVGSLAHRVGRPGPNGDVAVHAGAAAQAEVGGPISQVNLLDVTAGREVLGTLEHFHHAGTALAKATAVVDVVEALVGINSGIEGRFAQIGTLNASDLLAFLFKTDGGHGRAGSMAPPNLSHARHLP